MEAARRTAWTLGAIVAVAALLRLWRLGTHSLWIDEAYSLDVARGTLWQVLTDADQTPPLFTALLHFWIKIAGTSEWALRLPSALFGTAAVALTYPLALRLSDRRAALAATAIHAVAFYPWMASQDARAYATFLFFTVASFLAFVRLLDGWTTRRAALYAGATALLLYSHVYGLFFLLAQNLHVLLFREPVPPFSRRWAGTQLAVLALFAPWLPVLASRATVVAAGFWIPAPGLHRLGDAGVVLAGSFLLCLAMLPLGLAAVALAKPWRRAAGEAERERRRFWLLALWLAVPIAVPFLVAQRVHIFLPRYVLPCCIPLYVACGIALTRLRPAALRPVAAAALGALLLLNVAALQAGLDPAREPADWRAAVRDLDARAGPGDTVLFNTGICDSLGNDRQCAYRYYANRSDLRLVPFFNEGLVTPDNIARLDPIVAGQPRAWVFTTFSTDPGDLIGARLAGNFTLAWERHYPGIWLRGYERAPPAAAP
jgi:uncharacterized membrane protein